MTALINKEKKGINLDELQEETEKFLSLLKEREVGLMTWNMSIFERLEKMHTLISKALGK